MHSSRSKPASPANAKPAGYHGQARPEMVAFVPAGARRVLDVGCGEGLFGAEVKARRAAEVWGIELDPTAAAVAGKRLDRVLTGDVASAIAELPRGFFDCIVFNDVLEHLVDPRQILTAAKG